MKKNIFIPAATVFLSMLMPINLIAEGIDKDQQATPMVIEGGGTGQYKAIALGEETLPGFTIYRPKNLDDFGANRKLSIILWGNGGCMNSTIGAMNFLNEIASHGYMVFGIGPYSSLKDAPNFTLRMEAVRKRMEEGSDTPNRKTPPQGMPKMPPPAKTRMVEALDWAIIESSRESSIYFNKFDTGKVAVMGTSCGGLQAMEISLDPRVTTSLLFNSGILNSPPPAGMSLPKINKEMLGKLHAPIVYVIGGEKDIAYVNAKDDFSRIENVPVVMLNRDVGHGGTFREPHGGSFGKVAIDWLNWQLYSDAGAELIFKGENCGLCTDPDWKIETKNLK